MLFTKRILNSMGLKVELPMTLYLDNKGAVDLVNNWSIGGRTRHVEVKQHFLRDMKERGMVLTQWQSGDLMSSDLLTKNNAGPIFERHTETYCGRDEYMK